MIGIIYQIIDKNNTQNSYIGSTKNDTNYRFIRHKSRSKKCNTKFYTYVKNNGGWDNFVICILETVYNDSLRERENYYYDILAPSLNTYRPIKA